jgi:hypothetical protein
LFRLAIANNQFTDAEAAAKEVLKSPNAAPPVVQFLAHTIDIIASADQAYDACQNRGFRIVGINLDSQQNDGPKLDTVMPNIRRFVLDHNLPWPNLVNGTGALDYAKAYGVSEIPANILISRTGDVVHLDLSAKKLDSVVSQQSAQ